MPFKRPPVIDTTSTSASGKSEKMAIESPETDWAEMLRDKKNDRASDMNRIKTISGANLGM
jgi:hypothetical protein